MNQRIKDIQNRNIGNRTCLNTYLQGAASSLVLVSLVSSSSFFGVVASSPGFFINAQAAAATPDRRSGDSIQLERHSDTANSNNTYAKHRPGQNRSHMWPHFHTTRIPNLEVTFNQSTQNEIQLGNPFNPKSSWFAIHSTQTRRGWHSIQPKIVVVGPPFNPKSSLFGPRPTKTFGLNDQICSDTF